MPFAVVFTLLSSWIAFPAQSTPPARADISGAWTLNREAGAGPRAGADAGDRLPPPGGRRGLGGGFGGVGVDGPDRNSVQDREEQARRRALMEEVVEAPSRFQITIEDPFVIFTHADGRVVRYRTNWKDERHQFTSGTVKTKTRWDSGRLIIETDIGDGITVTHAYSLNPEAGQLVVNVQLPGQSRDIPAITHVYDEQTM
jgi:hypothetical protein